MKLIKEETIPLKVGEKSQDILLKDPSDPEVIHLSFMLNLISDDNTPSTHLSVSDPHRGTFIIKTMQGGITRPSQMIEIGTFGQEGHPLYVTYELYTYDDESTDSNRVKVSFYTEEN